MKKLLLISLFCLLPVSAKASGFLNPASSDLSNYRRPNLTYVSFSTVSLEGNTGTANETKLVFPDGNSRAVTEASGGLNKYRIADITQASVWMNCAEGGERSGLQANLTEGTSTWYSVYGVKSQCTNGSDKFVTVISTWEPTQGFYTQLNSTFGTSGWVYLGPIRNGDNWGNPKDIIAFKQNGNVVKFSTGASSISDPTVTIAGIMISSIISVANQVYTYTNTPSSSSLPTNIKSVFFQAMWTQANTATIANIALTTVYAQEDAGGAVLLTHEIPYFDISSGVLTRTSGGTGGSAMYLNGVVDDALGLNTTP